MKLQTLRRKAAEYQGWQCFYCQQSMWETDPKAFSIRYQLPERAVMLFRCTAEHLNARCDGGEDSPENVVAACFYCNSKRHKRKRPMDVESYAKYVRTRIEQGRWHSSVVLKHGTT